jgi:MFS family permease
MLPAGIRTLWAEDRARLLVIIAIFAMVTVNQTGTGILSAVMPAYLATSGYSASAAGAVSTSFSITFLIGCVIGPQIVRAIGPARATVIIGALNAALALLQWTFPGPVSWSLFRAAGGIVTAAYFVLIESWLAAQTTPATRGFIFGLYMVLIRVAFALGQIVISFVEPSALVQLLIVAALLYAASPALGPRGAVMMPKMITPSAAALLELPRLAPAAAAGSAVHGLVFGSVPNLIPKWGVDVGYSIVDIGHALAAMQLGGVFLQLPISYLSDRLERRTVMATCTLATAILSIAILALPTGGGMVSLALMFLWGGFSSSLYSLASAHAADLAPADKRVAWVSSIMLLWGLGAAAGPLIASIMMDLLGSSWLWRYGAIGSASAGLYLIWRKIVRP